MSPHPSAKSRSSSMHHTGALVLASLVHGLCLPVPVLNAGGAGDVAPRMTKRPELGNEYPTESRKFTGIPSMAVTVKGRMWATWYSGITPSEDQNNYVVVSTYRTDNSVKVVMSHDRGKTWNVESTLHVPAEVTTPDEPMIVERKDGSLWMLVRTKYGIGESVSTDKGTTWSPLMRSQIQHTPARFFLRRLNSGNLLLVKHGPINVKTARSHLMAFVSKNDGRSWSKGLLLDERNSIAYPDGQQVEDGTIYII